MYQSLFVICSLLVGIAEAAAVADDPTIDATIRGVLARSPGAFSERIPYIELTQTSGDGPFPLQCALVLPGDDFVIDAIAPFMDQSVVVTGEFRVHPKVLQKDGSRTTEYDIVVRTLSVDGRKAPIIGPTSPDGKWIAVQYKNGLRIYDTTTNIGKEIFPSVDMPTESAVNWNATARFSPTGKYVYASQGLSSSLWQLPGLNRIELKLANHDERDLVLAFSQFSQDARFLVMDAYQDKKHLGLSIAFRTKTGEESTRMKFDTDGDCTFSFLPDGRLLVVDPEDSMRLINLDTGEKQAFMKKK